MPQSLVKNYVHLVFSTKHRQPFIDKNIQPELYAYIGGICKNYKCYPYAIGGIEDHIRHQKISFKDEFRAFLKKYEVEYNERYVWD